jgi:hypothetical protein
MRETLTIAWDSLRIEGESILVEAHGVDAPQQAGITAIITRDTLDKAGESTLHAHLEYMGGMRGWLEGAIRARHSADQASGNIRADGANKVYRLVVQVEDFIRRPPPPPVCA